MYGAAVAAVAPADLIRQVDFLPAGVSFADVVVAPAGKLVVAALGKAAPGLAAAFLRRSERTPDAFFVLAPDGVPVSEEIAPHTRRAAHPLPDARGAAATGELLDLISTLEESDAVVLLLSGVVVGVLTVIAGWAPGAWASGSATSRTQARVSAVVQVLFTWVGL